MAKLIDQIDMTTLSPMMAQYVEQKKQYADCILFFRLGDFYEMFFDDALTASRELEIALTSRDCGQKDRAPMCGVPYHAAENYIAKLNQKNYKVAISEQMEDPSQAKGIVRRQVIRVITPGTITDIRNLDSSENNFILSVFQLSKFYGLAVLDITTGEFEAEALAMGATDVKLYDEIARYRPAEIVCNEQFRDNPVLQAYIKDHPISITSLDDAAFHPEPFAAYLDIAVAEAQLWNQAASGLLSYIEETQGQIPSHIHRLRLLQPGEYMELDVSARRNLELTETLRDKQKRGSLLWVLDRCKTAMGSRMMRRWVEQPLLNPHDILYRQEAVAELHGQFMQRQELREVLSGMHDIERLAAKVSMGQGNAHELLSLLASLNKLPFILEVLSSSEARLLRDCFRDIDPMTDIRDLIERGIDPDAPVALKEGRLIRPGFNDEVDQLREAAEHGQQWILDLESREREKTGIKTLKVGYNKVFGYYIEVTKANSSLVPMSYIRKQTLVNAERYITEELKEMEDSILGSESRNIQLQYETFIEIRDHVKDAAERLLRIARSIATLDVLQSLAETAEREHYVRPQVDESPVIDIKDGRHPVVERMLTSGSFVPNDAFIDASEQKLLIVTGPNMGGKSTYMRQVALITIMAQIGSFVPAKSAHIGVADRVFTRIGASDDLASGDSTFMVEMKEMANILRHMTDRSLLILDEIGRGTSTYDGLSIAWAIIEKIAGRNSENSRTLFATHYHELVDLEQQLDAVANYHVAVEEQGKDIIFLHKIVRGGSDDSYGIEVAKLAGVPADVVQRSREILQILEEANNGKNKLRIRRQVKQLEGQQDLFSSSLSLREYDDIIDELKQLDAQSMTPLDALNKIYDLSQRAKQIKRS